MAQPNHVGNPAPHDLTEQVVKEDVSFANGGFSKVYKGIWTRPDGTQEQVAVKELTYLNSDVDILTAANMRLRRESGFWCAFRHKNLLPFYGLCRAGTPFPWLISPFCKFGHVKQYVDANQDANRMDLICGIAEGLRYLHSLNVAHGDLTPFNVLVDDSREPRLCDFGRSRIIDGHTGYTTGTPALTWRFAAPELIDDAGAADDDEAAALMDPGPEITLRTRESDVYAFALVALDVLSGTTPFGHLGDMQAFLRAKSGRRPKRSHHQCEAITNDLWNLIQQCWAQRADERPTIVEACNSLAN